MTEIRDGYELGLLFRVMGCIDAHEYIDAGLDHDTAFTLLGRDRMDAFVRLGDVDANKAAGVIMARYRPQAERARQVKT